MDGQILMQPCEVCGKEIRVVPCLQGRKRFCGPRCRAIGVARGNTNPAQIVCLQCGKEIQSKDRLRAKYCGRKCYSEAKKVTRPNTNTARRRCNRTILADQCHLCGSTANVDRHHPDIENRPEDVEILCRKCHAKEHTKTGTWGRQERCTELIACDCLATASSPPKPS